MLIDSDVKDIGMLWSNSPLFTKILQCMILCEGPRDDRDAILRAIKTVPVSNRRQAIEVTARTLTHVMIDFIYETQHPLDSSLISQFISYLAHRWAPIKSENDPNGLNQNWEPNFRKFWSQA